MNNGRKRECRVNDEETIKINLEDFCSFYFLLFLKIKNMTMTMNDNDKFVTNMFFFEI